MNLGEILSHYYFKYIFLFLFVFNLLVFSHFLFTLLIKYRLQLLWLSHGLREQKRCPFYHRGLAYKIKRSRLPGVTGKFGLGVQNEAGQRLRVFYQKNTLIIENTLFQQHKRRLYTCISPDGQLWNQIDYIPCSWRWKSFIQLTQARTGTTCGSNHELLITKFRFRLSRKNHKAIQLWPKSNPLWL